MKSGFQSGIRRLLLLRGMVTVSSLLITGLLFTFTSFSSFSHFLATNLSIVAADSGQTFAEANSLVGFEGDNNQSQSTDSAQFSTGNITSLTATNRRSVFTSSAGDLSTSAEVAGITPVCPADTTLIVSGRLIYSEPGCTDDFSKPEIEVVTNRETQCTTGTKALPPTLFDIPPISTMDLGACSYKALRRARISLFDRDILGVRGGPSRVFTTLTDDDGVFVICGNVAPDSKRDYFARVSTCADSSIDGDDCDTKVGTKNPFSLVVKNSAQQVYLTDSSTVPEVCTGAIHWEVVDRRPNHNGAQQIFDILANDAFDYLDTEVGWQNEFRLNVQFPDDPTGFTIPDGIAHIKAGDELFPDKILQTYGFFTLYQLYSNSFPNFSPLCPSSDWGAPSDPSCAWIKGSATFLQAVIQNDPLFVNSVLADSGLAIDLEEPNPSVATQEDEGAIAATLWDIFDTQVEDWDNISLGLAPIWEVIQQRPADICEFVKLYDGLYDSIEDVEGITRQHDIFCRQRIYIDWINPISVGFKKKIDPNGGETFVTVTDGSIISSTIDAPDPYKKKVLEHVNDIFEKSEIDISVSEYQRNKRSDNALYVRFAPHLDYFRVVKKCSSGEPIDLPNRRLLGKAYEVPFDRFNKKTGGEVVVFLDPIGENADKEKEIAQIIAHEAGHGLGLVHINPYLESVIEVMDYDKAPLELIEEFTSIKSEIVSPPIADLIKTREECLKKGVGSYKTHNPEYHLRRYSLGELPKDIVGLEPGDWDTKKGEINQFEFLEVNLEIQDVIFDFSVLGPDIGTFGLGAEGPLTFSYFSSIFIDDLPGLDFRFSEKIPLRIFASSDDQAEEWDLYFSESIESGHILESDILEAGVLNGLILQVTKSTGLTNVVGSFSAKIETVGSEQPDGRSILIPEVIGLPNEKAKDVIHHAALALGDISGAYSNIVSIGNVISQNPTAGIEVTPGTPVDLVISINPELISVPNLVGLLQLNAENDIITAGLEIGEITIQSHETIPADYVISQDPVSASEVALGTPVNLVVSSGPALIPVPDVTGQAQIVAESTINAEGLSIGTITNQNSNTVPAGNVISQNPIAGTQVSVGTAVDLVISLGPVVVEINVPDVTGLNQPDASAVLSATGLDAGVITEQSSVRVPAGHIIQQDPIAGTSVAPGTMVGLVISLGRSEPLQGDLNNDNCVDRTDYTIIMTDIRRGDPHNPDYDLNGDTFVNRSDARTLIGLFTNPRGAPCNSRPIADAGADQTVAEDSTVNMNGSGSSDPENDPLTFAWTIVVKPTGTASVLTDATAVEPMFVADVEGTYVLRLIVNDGFQDSLPDVAIITTLGLGVENERAWRREGYDLGATARYPFSSEPNDRDLILLWQKPTRVNAAVLTEDLDGDTILDIISSDGKALTTYSGQGEDLWSVETSATLHYIGDVDGDKEPEVCVTYRDTADYLKVDVYDADGTFNKTLDSGAGSYDSYMSLLTHVGDSLIVVSPSLPI